MNQLNVSLWLAGMVSFIVVQPAWAIPDPAISDSVISAITAEEWMDQIAQAENSPVDRTQTTFIEITNIQVIQTDGGIDISIEATEDLRSPTSSIVGNALVIGIPDAVLALPEGEAFEVFSPSDDIAFISATNTAANQVRLTITGTDAPPSADLSTSVQGLTLSITPGTASGAIATDDDAIQIIVTAEKTPEEAQDVPISLTVLTEDEIVDADITSIEDISGNVPNFSFFSGENAVSPIYSIRGLGNFNFLSREAVAFYIDGVPYDRTNFISTDLPDIEQVEVLRGPQSTLYGRNALSGVVNVITRQPTNTFEFNGAASYSSFDTFDIRAGVSGPIVNDELFFRLSGGFFSRDGYIENSFLDDGVDERESLNGRAQLLWTPSDQWEISFNAFVEDLENGVNFVVVSDFDPADAFDVEEDVDNSFDRVSDTQALRIAYTHPDFRATSITARRFSRSEQRADADGSPLDIVVNTNDFESTVWSQEIRFQSPEDVERFEWLVGGYFESRQFSNENDGFTFGTDAASIGFPTGTSVTNGEVDETTWAGFAQVSYRPINPLTLTAGLRFESFDGTLESLESTFTPSGGSTLTTLFADDVEQDTDILLPRFVAEYRFNPDLMAYGSIARGYRPGGVNFRADETTFTFEEERAWNYEIGLKSSWLNNRLGANLSIFHTDVNDYQVLTADSFNISRIDNADVSITGAELEFRAAPLDGLDIIAGLGISDAEFTEFENFDGNQVPYAPNLTYNLALQYRARNGIFARAELQGVGTTYFNDANTLQQDSYAIVNARLGYEFEQVGIYVFANNIFDTKYFAQAADFAPFGFLVAPGAPATVGVQVRGQF
ncbi:MAG: TonB-dependent receptor domain-containing protein [Elainellaceae cyanobacterium]